MDLDKVVLSARYIDFINNIDELIFKALYSNNGYIFLKGKAALDEAKNYITSFGEDVQKLKENVNFEDAQNVIEQKTKSFISQIKKHYNEELFYWVDELYSKANENILTYAFSNKNNKKELINIYNKGIELINWFKNVKKYSENDKKIIIEKFNDKFEKIINMDEKEYIKQKNDVKTDVSLFLKLRNMILKDEDEFIKTDFNTYNQKLNKEDILFFNKNKNGLMGYKKTSTLDELYLINSAISVLNLKEDKDKYKFIKEVDNDFNLFISQNKQIKEQDKIDIVKRRIRLTKSQSDTNGNNLQYYSKLLISS